MKMLSNRDAITQRAMFIKELNDAIKSIKHIFNVENVDVVTDSAGDQALDLAFKLGFMCRKHYVTAIIGGGFVKCVSFKEGKEDKRFNFQYEKLTMLDAVSKTASPLYTYIIENDAVKSKPSTSGSGVKSNKTSTTEATNSDGGSSTTTILTDGVKGINN